MEDFDPSFALKHGDPSSEPRHPLNKKKLHQLDESHDHLFSNSFLHSLSREVAPIVDTSSAAYTNDVLFNLDFGDLDVGLGEEMQRDLEEAWNMKAPALEERPPVADATFDFEEYYVSGSRPFIMVH